MIPNTKYGADGGRVKKTGGQGEGEDEEVGKVNPKGKSSMALKEPAASCCRLRGSPCCCPGNERKITEQFVISSGSCCSLGTLFPFGGRIA